MDLFREEHILQTACGPLQRASVASKCGMVSFYELANFIGDFPGGSVVKNPFVNAGDSGSVPGLGRSPGERSHNPLQYSCLQNSMDRGTWWAIDHGVAKVEHNLVTKQQEQISMATQSSILAWKSPWTEKPGGLQSVGLHD